MVAPRTDHCPTAEHTPPSLLHTSYARVPVAGWKGASVRNRKWLSGPFPLCALGALGGAVALAVVVGLLAGVARDPRPSDTWQWVLVVVGIAAAAVLAWIGFARPGSDREVSHGILAIAVVTAAATATTVHLIRPRQDWIWLQFLIVVALFLVALAVIASEWSRRWLLVFFVLVASGLLVSTASVGYRHEVVARLEKPINKAIETKTQLEESAIERLKTPDQLLKAQEEARTKLTDALVDVESYVELSSVGVELVEHLGDTGRRALLADLLRVPASHEDVAPVFVEAVRAAAIDAVAAYDAKVGQAPSTDAVDLAITQACAAAKAADATPEKCGRVCADAEADIASALRDLEVEVARYRFAVTAEDEDKAVRDALVADEPDDLRVALVSALAAGPEALLDSTDAGALGLVPGPLGWALLGFATILTLRKVLSVNAQQVAGPVVIDYEDAHAPEFRTALLANLDAPGTTPGAVTAQSITDITGLVDPTSRLTKLFQVVASLLAPPQGFVVTADVVTAPKAAGDASGEDATKVAETRASAVATRVSDPAVAASNTVLVRITSADDGGTLATASFVDEDLAKAVQAGGYWAAGTLLSRSTRIPSWAAWNEQTADAMSTASARKPSLDELRESVGTAPNSGILLLSMAYELELSDRPLEALLYLARCVEAHPRYPIASYRLGVTIGMIGRDVNATWGKATAAERRALLHGLGRAALSVGFDEEFVVDFVEKFGTDQAGCWRLAEEFLGASVEDLERPANLVASLRRSDRDVVFRRSRVDTRRPHRRWRLQALARSAKLVYVPEDQRSTEDLADLESDLNDRRAGWQLRYNEACRLAQTSPTRALEALEQCLALDGSGQLTRDWPEKDPDLAPLNGHPRFTAFLAQLRRTNT